MLRAAIVVLLTVVVLLPAPLLAAGSDVISTLQQHDAYVSAKMIAAGRARAGDAGRLDAQARTAAAQGVPEKIAILSSYPSNYANASQAADALRNTLSFSGVMVLVTPGQIALSSDRLSRSEMTAIAVKASPRCSAQTYTACALFAGQQAVTKVRADNSASSRSSTILWLVVLAVIAGVALFAFGLGRRRKASSSAELTDLRRAADNTLAQADEAVQRVEAALQGRRQLDVNTQVEFDRALALRETASNELKNGATAAMLVQANQDAAHAVLALQGVMRLAGIQVPSASPLESPMHRCFYCGHTDRPPYTARTITDDRGNNMQVEVCALDEERLQSGRRPEVATVQYNGAPVPWYAVPGNPWYYAYGGPTWQYWLPFMIGMDVGNWFGGGWNAGWGGGDAWNAGPAGGWDNGWSGDPGAAVPSDAGQADFGGGWDSGSGSDGGWDSGGADFGGGSDFGGGDSGWS